MHSVEEDHYLKQSHGDEAIDPASNRKPTHCVQSTLSGVEDSLGGGVGIVGGGDGLHVVISDCHGLRVQTLQGKQKQHRYTMLAF